jgi:hypothetical protein
MQLLPSAAQGAARGPAQSGSAARRITGCQGVAGGCPSCWLIFRRKSRARRHSLLPLKLSLRLVIALWRLHKEQPQEASNGRQADAHSTAVAAHCWAGQQGCSGRGMSALTSSTQALLFNNPSQHGCVQRIYQRCMCSFDTALHPAPDWHPRVGPQESEGDLPLGHRLNRGVALEPAALKSAGGGGGVSLYRHTELM